MLAQQAQSAAEECAALGVMEVCECEVMQAMMEALVCANAPILKTMLLIHIICIYTSHPQWSTYQLACQ